MVHSHEKQAPAAPIYTYQRAEYEVSTDPARLDMEMIHRFLHHSYWSPGIPREVVATALYNSLCFGLYCADQQIGLARVVTDYASMAYIADVFVLSAYRGQGLATWLMHCVAECPALAPVRMLLLATRDAHELYRKVGFGEFAQPDRWMMVRRKQAWHDPALIIE